MAGKMRPIYHMMPNLHRIMRDMEKGMDKNVSANLQVWWMKVASVQPGVYYAVLFSHCANIRRELWKTAGPDSANPPED